MQVVFMICDFFLAAVDDGLDHSAAHHEVSIDNYAQTGIPGFVVVASPLTGHTEPCVTGPALERTQPERRGRGPRDRAGPGSNPLAPVRLVNTLADATVIVGQVDGSNRGLVFETHHLWKEMNLPCRIPYATDGIQLIHNSDLIDKAELHNDRLWLGSGIYPPVEVIRQVEDRVGIYAGEPFDESLRVSDFLPLVARCRSQFKNHCLPPEQAPQQRETPKESIQ